MEKLFKGAAATASQELGISLPADADTTTRSFAAWRATLGRDKDVASDARMMVPVFYDEERDKTKVWVFLGWQTTDVDVEYRVEPNVVAVESSQGTADPPAVFFAEDHCKFAVPVLAEVYVSRLLDRDEFRKHCDRHRTRDAILKNLR